MHGKSMSYKSHPKFSLIFDFKLLFPIQVARDPRPENINATWEPIAARAVNMQLIYS